MELMGVKRGPGRPRNDDPNTTRILSRSEIARKIQDAALDYYLQDDILSILDTYGQIVMDALMEGRGVYVYGVGRIIGKRVPPRGYKIYGTETRIGVADSYIKPTMKFLPSFEETIKTASCVKAEDYEAFLDDQAAGRATPDPVDDGTPSEEEMLKGDSEESEEQDDSEDEIIEEDSVESTEDSEDE